MATPPAPDALLFMTGHCPHCPAVLQALGDLLKAGRLGRLEVVNIELRPEQAQALGVRGVPWIRVGEFELQGLHSRGELEVWIGRAASATGMRDYFQSLLNDGQVKPLTSFIRRHPQQLPALMDLLGDPDMELQVRLGIGVIMEELQGSALLQQQIERLTVLTRHQDARIRADACHYLTLSNDPGVADTLRQLLNDEDADVRETAQDGLDALTQPPLSGDTPQ